MKKWILLLMVLSLLLCGCSVESEMEKPLKFFYPVNNGDYSFGSSYIQPEIREGATLGNGITDVLNAYLKGPVDQVNYSMPFQYNTQVHSIYQNGSILTITLTRGFATYTGMPLTIACACITLTILELTNAQTVRIQAHNTTLDGAEYIEMSLDTILLLDIGTPVQE